MNHHSHAQELSRQVERLQSQCDNLTVENSAMKAKYRGLEMLIGSVVATIPVNKVLKASQNSATLVEYFKNLHVTQTELVSAVKAKHAEEVAELVDILALALPYVECSMQDDGYKFGSVLAMTGKIKAAIAKFEVKS